MERSTVFNIVMWGILLVITIVLLAIGIKPKDLVGEFIGLAVPLVYLLVRKRRK